MNIPLGPFELHTCLAQGGMGDIWEGLHLQQQVPVAVKVVSNPHNDSEENQAYYQFFRKEVQAVARLNHPGIVMVFDYGTLSKEVEQLSEGALRADSPYLVMEYASGGSLDQRPYPTHFSELRAILFALLDALAHAHARGMVHRDLKPGNVLACTRDDPRPGLKLTDFGIAHASEYQSPSGDDVLTSGTEELPSGTPFYMAPEQFRGRWRDYGAWTDLYSFGIMAYELACGRVPFDGRSFLNLGLMHLQSELPPFEPSFAVPSGFDAWIRCLTAKRPEHRFQRAIDAAWALRELGDVTPNAAPSPLQRPALRPTESRRLRYTHQMDYMATIADGASLNAAWNPTELPERTAPPVVPLGSWRTLADEQINPNTPVDTGHSALVGAGLGLFGLREISLVGREEEREALWKALREVHEQRLSKVVVLEGDAGIGKTRLAQWVCERAHEVGAAEVLKAQHGRIPGPSHGLRRMVSSYFRCTGLPQEKMVRRCRDILKRQGVTDAYEWNALARMLLGGRNEANLSTSLRAVRFASLTERYTLLQRLMARMGHVRPLIVVLDDVQWGPSSLGFVEHVLNTQDTLSTAVLFVLAVRTDALANRDLERNTLKRLLEQPHTRHLVLEPLPEGDTRTLVHNLIGLSDQLADQLVTRSRGNPLYAVQILGDWIESGELVQSPQGFILKPGSQTLLPADLTQVWDTTVERHLEGWSEGSRMALALAAVLDGEVDAQELSEACKELGLSFPWDRLDALYTSRQIERNEDGGWCFTHAMFRDTLIRRAREQGYEADLHRACASMLGRSYPEGYPGIAERQARHMIAAGDLEAALEILLIAVDELLEESEYQRALDLLDERDALLQRLGFGDDHVAWAEGWTFRATIHQLRWEFAEASAWVERIIDKASTHSWLRLIAAARTSKAQISRRLGKRQEAWNLHKEALAYFEWSGDQAEVAVSLLHMAALIREQGQLTTSVDLYNRAYTLFERLGDAIQQAQCLYGLGHVHRQRQDLTGATEMYKLALAMFEDMDCRQQQAECLRSLADLRRYQGEMDQAEQGYQRALDIFKMIGSKDALLVQLNLAYVHIARGTYDKARELIEPVLVSLEASDYRVYLAHAHTAMLPCEAY
ncbi:MAG: protein kinase, partial [Myxococcota bacterium]